MFIKIRRKIKIVGTLLKIIYLCYWNSSENIFITI